MTSIADNKLLMHQIGEVFDISASGEDRDGNYIENDKISVCVDAVQVEDNLQLLGQNNVPEEWTDAVGTDGNLVNNTLSYIKSGNGIDSVDEIVKTESVKQSSSMRQLLIPISQMKKLTICFILVHCC